MISTRPVVADASALVEYLLQSPRGERVSELMTARTTDLHAPTLCDVEVMSALRGLERRGLLRAARMREALLDYLDLPVMRHGHEALLPRILELRHNFSAYDATYVALAERLEARFLTGDRRLASAVEDWTDLDSAI